MFHTNLIGAICNFTYDRFEEGIVQPSTLVVARGSIVAAWLDTAHCPQFLIRMDPNPGKFMGELVEVPVGRITAVGVTSA